MCVFLCADETLKDDLAGTTAVVVLLKEGKLFCVCITLLTSHSVVVPLYCTLLMQTQKHCFYTPCNAVNTIEVYWNHCLEDISRTTKLYPSQRGEVSVACVV